MYQTSDNDNDALTTITTTTTTRTGKKFKHIKQKNKQKNILQPFRPRKKNHKFTPTHTNVNYSKKQIKNKT